jgi:hypothetical protein
MAKPPLKPGQVPGRPVIPPGKLTIRQLLDSTRVNFGKQDWSRAKAQGRHFSGDKGLLYDTHVKLNKPSRAPWGIRFQTITYAPEQFGTDDHGRFPRQWVQYIELPFDYDRKNVRSLRQFRAFCNCPRYRFTHHYVLWKTGHAPKPKGKGLEAPNYARRGSRAPAVCKHLVLAMLAVNRASITNTLPKMLPDKAWAQIEKYWAGVESGNNDAMMANLKNAPDSVRKLAVKVAQEGKPRQTINKFTRSDWSDKNLKIPRTR